VEDAIYLSTSTAASWRSASQDFNGTFSSLEEWRSQFKILEGAKSLGAKLFDFRRAIVFYLEYYLSKHKMTKYAKNLGRPWTPVPPPWPRLLLEAASIAIFPVESRKEKI